jgi:hypothetical protein
VSYSFPTEFGLVDKNSSGLHALKSDFLAAGLVGAFVGLLGLWPHLAFMNEIGDLRYFHGAYDEDSYARSWFLGTLRSTRALSGFALSVVYSLCSSSLDTTLIVSDFIFPFLATCAAYFAASQVVSSRSGRVLAALLLVFANDLFSLGNIAVWTPGRFDLPHFSKAISLIGPNLVPFYETSFLAVFRTPEPQVSFSLMFAILGFLARSATGNEWRTWTGSAVAIVAISLLPLGYTFVTLPIAAIVAGSVVVFALFRMRSATTTMAVGLLGATLMSIAAYYWQAPDAQSNAGFVTHLSYYSRAPIITPAVLGSLVLGVPFGLWIILTRHRQPLAYLALGCLLIPAFLNNQQIVTGVMISARDWERNVNYPVLVFGIVAALSLVVSHHIKRWPDFIGSLAWICSAVIIVVVCRGQLSAFRMWEPDNVESIAIVRALKSADSTIVDRSSLAFEDASVAQLIQVRMNNKVIVPLTYYGVAISFVPNMAPEARSASPSPYEEIVFEHWLRVGLSPEEAEHLLRSEIQQRAGLYTKYLFSFRDAWYPASDNRAVRQAELERSVEPIITRFKSYLLPENHRHVFDRPALLISGRSPAELPATPWIHNEHIGKGSAKGVAAYVYRQSQP